MSAALATANQVAFDKSGATFDPIPTAAGIGLKAVHYEEILGTRPDIGWFEVHPENYMGAGGPPHRYLTAIREHYPLSLHGVGMSLGGTDPLDEGHLSRFRALVDRYQPGLVSEHLAWASHGGIFFNDLLPLPLTEETLANTARHVSQMQDVLGRRVLVENPSTYLETTYTQIPEPEFLTELALTTGCGLLVDINNVLVCALNHGFDPLNYLDALPASLVGEIHLAGHAVESVNGTELRIDDHGSPVSDPVWELYALFVERVGSVPTLIERDKNIPTLSELVGEAHQADDVMAMAAQLGPVLGASHG